MSVTSRTEWSVVGERGESRKVHAEHHAGAIARCRSTDATRDGGAGAWVVHDAGERGDICACGQIALYLSWAIESYRRGLVNVYGSDCVCSCLPWYDGSAGALSTTAPWRVRTPVKGVAVGNEGKTPLFVVERI